MELFDPNGDQPWRNILWMIALAIAGICLTVNYSDSVKREKREATYEQSVAYVTNAEEWVRVSKKNGRETSRKNYYKFAYKFDVGSRTYNGNGSQDNIPDKVISVYYDPRNPATHVLKRHKSDDALAFLLLGGLAIFAFLGVNIYLYKSKRAKLGIGGGSSGSFK